MLDLHLKDRREGKGPRITGMSQRKGAGEKRRHGGGEKEKEPWCEAKRFGPIKKAKAGA